MRTLPGAEKAALEVCTELASYRKCQIWCSIDSIHGTCADSAGHL